jgi:hypothetical protein
MRGPSLRVRSRDNARRTVLWCAAALCLSPLFGGWLVDRCPVDFRDEGAAECLRLWRNAKPEPNVIVLGSSRLGTFVRVSELAALTNERLQLAPVRILNAAMIATEPIGIEFLVRRLLACRASSPRLVLLEISPDLLGSNNPYLSFTITRALTAADLPKYASDILVSRGAVSRLLSSRLTPFFRHREHLLLWAIAVTNHRSESRAETMPGGANAWEAVPMGFARDKGDRDPFALEERMQRGARRFTAPLRHYRLAGGTSAALESTVQMLRAHGCFVVLVQPPLSSAQRALLSDEVRRPFTGFVQRLQTVYGCRFAEYSAALPDKFFVDNHHANNEGSFVFTQLLARDVLVPAWQEAVADQTDPAE